MDYEDRQKRLRERMGEKGLEAAYITNLTNVRYLCGFTGSNGALVIGTPRSWFLTDGRYDTQSREEVEAADIEVYATPDSGKEALAKRAAALDTSKVGFEGAHVTLAKLEELQEVFGDKELVATSQLVEELRRIKDDEEVALIRTAAEMADAGFEYILDRVEVAKTEKDVALELEFFLRREGADHVSFDLIVAAAEQSALPHATPGERLLEKGRYLLFDLGCRHRGYCSDLTRTVILGPADDRHREVYETVLESNLAGLEAVSAGRAASEVDEAARKIITKTYPEAFLHGLGHGVGLEVHEAPTLRSTSEDVLRVGDVVTIEPGAYFAGWGGVRIEDLVLVTEDGSEVLSKSSKQLREL